MPGPQTWIIIAFVLGMVCLDWLIISTIVRNSWGEIARSFSPRPIAPDAVRRSFQSFRVGLMSLGWCVHVAADDTHLHLLPARLPRLLGCRAASIPWDQVTHVRKLLRWSHVRIAGVDVRGPAWCLNLAESPAPGAPGR